MKHIQPEYNPVLKDLFKRANQEYKLYLQWRECPKPEWASTAISHLTKAQALVELLESVTVFNVGGGYNQVFLENLEVRLRSFSRLADK